MASRRGEAAAVWVRDRYPSSAGVLYGARTCRGDGGHENLAGGAVYDVTIHLRGKEVGV